MDANPSLTETTIDRLINYPGQIGPDTDLLNVNRNVLVGLGWTLASMLGAGTFVDALACTATSPASLQVRVAPGVIYADVAVDGTAYGSLGTSSNIIKKQGLSLSPTTLTLTAPTTSGQSVNYLVQVTYSDVDSNNQVLSYFNSSNPSLPYTGPSNTGASQPTTRQGVCVISLLAGTPGTTGSQTTPTPSLGYTGLYVITVNFGQTTVTNSQITQLATAPFLGLRLPSISSTPPGTVAYFAMSSAPSGWFSSNGAALSRITYAPLYAAIGTVFGSGDGFSTYNLPDLRGQFIRGSDNGAGIDPSRVFGSAQADVFASHTHYTPVTDNNYISLNVSQLPAGPSQIMVHYGGQSGTTGDVETRPKNVALLACIKY